MGGEERHQGRGCSLLEDETSARGDEAGEGVAGQAPGTLHGRRYDVGGGGQEIPGFAEETNATLRSRSALFFRAGGALRQPLDLDGPLQVVCRIQLSVIGSSF